MTGKQALKRRLVMLLSTLMVLALLVAACGDGDEPDASGDEGADVEGDDDDSEQDDDGEDDDTDEPEEPATGYFDGQTLRVIAPSSPGGGTDINARLNAQWLADTLAGDVTVVVENMGGGGGVVAYNYLYNVAPRDGYTIIGSGTPSPIISQLMGDEGVEFDSRELTYLGNVVDDSYAIFLRTDAGPASLDELIESGEQISLGTVGATHPHTIFAMMVQAIVDSPIFNVVAGYEGSAESDLDLERGAIHATPASVGPFVEGPRGEQFLDTGMVFPLVYSGPDRYPDFPDTPAINEYVTSDRGRGLLNFIDVMVIPGRHLVAPPDIPDQARDELRAAFEIMRDNPDYQAEVEAHGFEFGWFSGDEIAETVTSAFEDDDLIEEFRGLVEQARQ